MPTSTPRPHRLTRVLGATLVLLLAGTGCTHDFTLENRQTPVHVWMAAPDVTSAGMTVDALVYVGDEKAVEGPVHFPPGVTYVALPRLYMTSGRKYVSAVLQGGAVSANSEVKVDGETWIVVIYQHRAVQIKGCDFEPATR